MKKNPYKKKRRTYKTRGGMNNESSNLNQLIEETQDSIISNEENISDITKSLINKSIERINKEIPFLKEEISQIKYLIKIQNKRITHIRKDIAIVNEKMLNNRSRRVYLLEGEVWHEYTKLDKYRATSTQLQNKIDEYKAWNLDFTDLLTRK